MNLELPVIPAGVLTLLAFFAPYAVALINRPEWPSAARKWVAIGVAVVLAAVVLAGYYLLTGDAVPEWPVLVLLSLVVMQASYALVTKGSADKVELATHKSVDPPREDRPDMSG